MNCKVNVKCFLLLLLILLFGNNISAQTQRVAISFGDVKTDDFAPTAYSIDSSADAVYLFNGGHSNLVQNYYYFFTLQFTRHARIRLLKQSSFSDPEKDLVNIVIPIAETKDFKEKLLHFQAAIYTLSDGKVMMTNFDKKNLIKDKAIKTNEGTIIEYKFTFPNVKEGCIVEYSYTVDLPENGVLPSWEFQNKYPCLWSEYELTRPEFYNYVESLRGTLKCDMDSVIKYHVNYNLPNQRDNYTNTIDRVWGIKNVKPITAEPFMATLYNYASFISFRLSSLSWIFNRRIFFNAADSNKGVYVSPNYSYFGVDPSSAAGYLPDVLIKIIDSSANDLDKAQKIYKFVRDSFTNNGEHGIYISQPLRETVNKRSGSATDVNLLLSAFYRNAGMESSPVILSTRSNGYVKEEDYDLEKFNYAICMININKKEVLLDASNKYLSFGHLPAKCYNGLARIVNSVWKPIIIAADSVIEFTVNTASISNGKSGEMVGEFTSNPGYFTTLGLREQTDTLKQEEYFNQIKKEYPFDISITATSIDPLAKPDLPVSLKYNFTFSNGGADIIYFNPMLSERIKENPFKYATRSYPIEMPYCVDKMYTLDMEIPNGYIVDELPESASINLNDSDGIFQYKISKTDSKIQFSCRLSLNKANFLPSAYQSLRDFYAYVVKKEDEQIVFKKIK